VSVTEPPAAGRIGGRTKTAGVIGWPVDHSLSPVIHNAAAAALGVDFAYVPMPVRPSNLPAALDGLGALGFEGANVTMPHKTEAATLVDELSEDAGRLGAVNTVVVIPAGLSGHNTDSPGFDRFVRLDAGFDPGGRSALIYGAGGAARACALAMARADLRQLTVAARNRSAAGALGSAIDGFAVDLRVIGFEDVAELEVELVVNATPVGAHGEDLPLPRVTSGTLVVDLLYDPAVTPLQRSARAAGATAFGGLGLLLHQAALSFELWTGQAPPLEVMSAAALAELADRS
jgi:shikimate dehydrogenase